MTRLISMCVVAALAAAVAGQEPPASSTTAEDPLHQELRDLRERMFQHYTQRDVDGLLTGMEENIVITWQNGERNLSPREFVAFYDKMMKGEQRIVKDVSSDFTVDGLSLLYGDDTAVAYGTCVDHFKLTSGRDFQLTSKWTATVVKSAGGWKIASFHISANIFDNPILNTATGWLLYGSVGSGIIGVVLGFVIARVMRRRGAAKT